MLPDFRISADFFFFLILKYLKNLKNSKYAWNVVMYASFRKGGRANLKLLFGEIPFLLSPLDKQGRGEKVLSRLPRLATTWDDKHHDKQGSKQRVHF